MEIWEKVKKLYTGQNKWLVYIATGWLLYFLWSWFFGSGNTIGHWIDARRDYRNQNAQIEFYQKSIENMDMVLDQRESNLDTLEKFAREQYYFAAPGEVVYIIEE